MVSVVMPAYNEAQYLATAIRTVHDGLMARGHQFELVVVENGSVDATDEVLNHLADEYAEVRRLSLPEPDYGLALRQGFAAAVGDHLVIFDVDHVDLDFMDAALARLASPRRPAIVLGSKRGPGAVDRRPRHRRVITAVFSTLIKVVFGLGVPDTHGIKVLNRRAVEPLVEVCRSRSDLFGTELVLRAERAGLLVDHLPIDVSELRAPRSPILHRVPRTLVGLARLRWALWFDRV